MAQTTTRRYWMPNSPIATSSESVLVLLAQRFGRAYVPAGNIAWDHERGCGIVCGEIVVPVESGPEAVAAARGLCPRRRVTLVSGPEILWDWDKAGRKYYSGDDLANALIAAGLASETDRGIFRRQPVPAGA